MKRPFIQVCIIGLSLLGIIGLPSCANMSPPTGGARDSLAPRLAMANPKDSAVNVNVNLHQLTLLFDEFITLDNPFTNLIVSPTLKNQPTAEAKLNRLTISFKKDTLEPNTTYYFDFGNTIKDVNEGNITRGFTYAFSTGPTMDMNSYGGKVLMAETGKTDSTEIIAILHRDLSDSAVYKEKPRYYTRLNGRGEFLFQHLPAGRFAVYVMDKNSYQKTYSDSSFRFGFRNAPVTVGSNTPTDTLYVYQAYKKNNTPPPSTGAGLKLPGKDDKRLRYSIDFEMGLQDILSDMHIGFLRKLSVFDSSKIGLYDTSYHLLPGYSVSIDSSKTKLTLKYPWKENTSYRLLIDKDAVADSAGINLPKADTIRFATKKETDYGSIRLRFTNLDLSKNPVLQFVQSDRVVDSFPLTETQMTRKRYKPGNYDLRILYDINKNGKWVPGQFLPNKRQPEIVVLIPRQLVIRGNWDNEVNIIL